MNSTAEHSSPREITRKRTHKPNLSLINTDAKTRQVQHGSKKLNVLRASTLQPNIGYDKILYQLSGPTWTYQF